MYEEFLNELLKSVVVLFIVVDPVGNVPIFIGLTKGMDKQQRKRVFKIATITAWALLMVFSLAGHQFLLLFGISLSSLMIAGGILLLILAIKIIFYGEFEGKSTSDKSTGVVPIAFPLLAGPGAITTTIVSFERWGAMITPLSVVIVLVLTWAILRLIDPVHRFLGEIGAAVVARVMAIFLAAIAIQFIADGLGLTL